MKECDVEQAAIYWLSALGWQLARGPDIAPDMPKGERADYGQVVLERRLRDGLAVDSLDDAYRKLTR